MKKALRLRQIVQGEREDQGFVLHACRGQDALDRINRLGEIFHGNSHLFT